MSWLFYAAVAGLGVLAAIILFSDHGDRGGHTPHTPRPA